MAEVELPDLEELSAASDRFSKRVALMTAVYAVMLAVASLGGSNAMKEMLLAQQEASNQWAFYQAKAIREHQYRVQKLVLEADLEERRDTMKPQSRRKLEAALQRFTEEEKRYAEEKKDIEKAARKHEAERDRNQAKDPYFDYAEVLATALLLVASAPGVWAQLDRLANTTPQERAKVQTEFMTSRLGLTPDQTRTVGALNLTYAQRMEPVIKGSEGPFMKLRQMREINQAKEAELQGILSPDQVAKYQASREEMRQKFEEWAEEKR